jgi:hypothetical protein
LSDKRTAGFGAACGDFDFGFGGMSGDEGARRPRCQLRNFAPVNCGGHRTRRPAGNRCRARRVTSRGQHHGASSALIPVWLHTLAVLSLLAGLAIAVVIAFDVLRYPQHMGVMNVVWPVTALYGGVLALWFYFRHGRQVPDAQAHRHQKPFPLIVATGTTHCGAGCMLGDIVAEWLAFLIPAVAFWFGWQTLFADKMFAVWVLDFLFAFVIGIGFQYFAIVPMRGLSFGPGIVAALKADTLSLMAWQIGMYGFMALAQFGYFRPQTGQPVAVNTPEFWFTMQIAMLAGFVTSYPVNWWLIRAGIKEKM